MSATNLDVVRRLPIRMIQAGFGTGGMFICDWERQPKRIHVAVPHGCGFTLQSRGSGFVLEKGHPNALEVTSVSRIFIPRPNLMDHQGGKRPYHTIIPALVTRHDDLFMTYGVMGGFMQPQGHVQVLLNILRGFNVQAALDAPRFCIDAEPITSKGSVTSRVFIEEGISPDVVDELRSKSPPPTGP